MQKNEKERAFNMREIGKRPFYFIMIYQCRIEKEEISSYKNGFKRVKKIDWGLI